jgi:chemotaxis signal transduction protein
VLDIALDAPAAPADANDPPTERAQAIRCGGRWIAFPYGWARSAVDQVQLSAVPGAPAWLAGAANIEGRIVPVVDLVAWATPGRFADAQAKDARLLVGGDGDDSVAVLFHGLPRLVGVTRRAAPNSPTDRLARYVVGRDPGDADTVAVDAAALVDALIEELALR